MTDQPKINGAEMLAFMKSRRAVRNFTSEPVSDDDLWQMAQAGRWSSNGGNFHPHRFLIVRDPVKIRQVQSFSPGMITPPTALIVLLTDHDAAKRLGWDFSNAYVHWVDTGTSAQNMMNMAHALGLGTCPVTSFSHSGVATVLGLPAHITPELLLMIGHPQPMPGNLNPGSTKSITTKDLTYWDEVDNHDR